MAREKLRQPAGLLDHSAVEHDAFARLSVRGLVTHQHQAVLQQRLFVFTSTHRRDQTRRQSLVDEAVIHLRRAADRAHKRVVIHAWNEILGLVDGLGEAVEPRALAEEFRAHRDDDMHLGRIGCRLGIHPARRATNQLDEQFRLLAARLLLIAEELLELIDQDAQALAREPLERAHDRRERRPAAVEEPLNRPNAVEVVAALFQLHEFRREIPQRAVRRPHRAGEPRRAVAQMLAREFRHDARSDKARLAGTRSAVDNDEAITRESIDHIVDHALPAKEDRPLMRLERPQTWVGLRRPLGGEWRSNHVLASALFGRAASSQPRNSPRQFSRLTSKCSIPNGATSIGMVAPVLSRTAQGRGAPRASAMRARSSTPISMRSPTKRSGSWGRNSANASQRLAVSILAPLSCCQLARPPSALTRAVRGTRPSCVRTRPISIRAGSQSAGACK